MTRRPPPDAAYNVDLTEIQSLALSGHGDLPEACYLLLRLDDAKDRLGAWLAETAKQVSFGRAEGKRYTSVNVAFSHPGFAACGLESRALAEFGPAFREGMSGSAHRSRDLGDVGECAPDHWRWGNVQRPKSLDPEFPKEDPKHVDAVLMLFGADDTALDKPLADAQKCAAACNIREVVRLRAAWPKAPQFEGLREHFGFVDGISQPWFRLQAEDDASDLLAPGELLLGYPNEAGEIVCGPTVRATPTARTAGLRLAPDGGRCDLGRGGTYLVLREIDQDVIAFWQFARDSASDVLTMEHRAAKIVGRWRNGAPLTLAREEPTSFFKVDERSNNFAFRDAEDADGFACPFGAHIRRANPRDTIPRLAERRSLAAVRRHRILRRGRPYGNPVLGWPDPKLMLEKAGATPDPAGTRGLYFACLNADIEQQFEVVQQRWLNDPTFVNGRWDEVDPLLGRTRAGGQFIVPTTSGPLVLGNADVPLRRFVTVRGGEYFFLPSKSALSYLATIRHEG